MKRWLEIVFALWLALAASNVFAAPAAVVESVQMPAWVERAGRQLPAAPGMELIATDALRTGPGARLYVKLAEGSILKLGENARLQLLDLIPERGGLFRATLDVLAGAFRFTTETLAKPRPRDFKFRISTVTAGIRGTDLWGRSVKDNEIVCLIEGAIEVGAENEKPVRMDQPRQFYQRDKGKTQPLSILTKERLAELAQETEIESGKGAARRGGKWKVTLAQSLSKEAAGALLEKLHAAGYAAETRAQGKRTYAVRIAQLPSKAEADALAAKLRGQHGVSDPKVSN
ncbi:MAG TPA: SPOR domain-containing protein [Burkholderiales bacterium]|nr:SPOR domain-containing protein [Burkholderiales bacterium]